MKEEILLRNKNSSGQKDFSASRQMLSTSQQHPRNCKRFSDNIPPIVGSSAVEVEVNLQNEVKMLRFIRADTFRPSFPPKEM